MTAPPMPIGAPQAPPMPQGAVQPPQPPPPFTDPPPFLPFSPRPNDTEPELSTIWTRKLSRIIASAKYTAFGPEWKDVLDQQYIRCRQASATASAGAQAGQKQQATQPGGPAPALQPQAPEVGAKR